MEKVEVNTEDGLQVKLRCPDCTPHLRWWTSGNGSIVFVDPIDRVRFANDTQAMERREVVHDVLFDNEGKYRLSHKRKAYRTTVWK